MKQNINVTSDICRESVVYKMFLEIYHTLHAFAIIRSILSKIEVLISAKQKNFSDFSLAQIFSSNNFLTLAIFVFFRNWLLAAFKIDSSTQSINQI